MTEVLDRHYESLGIAPWVHTEVHHTVDLNHTEGKGPCSIARGMIAKGADPLDRVTFIRGKTVCFHAAPLGTWAKLKVVESEGGRDMRFVAYDRHHRLALN